MRKSLFCHLCAILTFLPAAAPARQTLVPTFAKYERIFVDPGTWSPDISSSNLR